MMIINPHPPLTSFPIAICFIITVCEIFKHLFKKKELSTVCNYLTLFGLIIFPLVYYSGYEGVTYVSKDFNYELISAHQDLAKFFLFTCIPYLVLRTAIAFEKTLLGMISDHAKEIIETMLTCFSIAILGLVIYTSHLGGNLVYEHGATVKTCQSQNTLEAKECTPNKPKTTGQNSATNTNLKE